MTFDTYITLWAPFSCLTFFLALLFISFAGLLWNEPGPENNIVHLLSKFSPPRRPSGGPSVCLAHRSNQVNKQTRRSLRAFIFLYSLFLSFISLSPSVSLARTLLFWNVIFQSFSAVKYTTSILYSYTCTCTTWNGLTAAGCQMGTDHLVLLLLLLASQPIHSPWLW